MRIFQDKDLKFNPVFAVMLFTYLLSGILLIKYKAYEGIWGDGIAYINIAHRYAAGDFKNAINGYWGPLFSWLLSPLLLIFGSTPLSSAITAKALLLIIGLFTIVGARKLSYTFEISDKIRNLVMLPLIPIVLSYLSFHVIVPDLLFLCVLLFYLAIVFKKTYPERISNGLLSGVLGALLYFSKPYGFPFFISHFILINTFHYFRIPSGEKKKVILNAFIGMFIFLALAVSWIVLISSKYGYTTFSTAGTENYSIVAPAPDKKIGRHHDSHLYNEGFYKPHDERAINVFEDLSYLYVKSWSPFESWANFRHQILLCLKNAHSIAKFLILFTPLSFIIISAYVLLCIRPVKELLQRGDILYPLSTMILYSGGYTIPFVSQRYIWIDNILLLLMGGHLLSLLFQHEFFKIYNLRKNILIALVITSFIVLPIQNIIHKPDRGKEIYLLSKKLESYNIQGKIASHKPDPDFISKEWQRSMMSWLHTLTLSYYLGTKYYGQSGANMSEEDLERELKKFDIDFYFVWGNHTNIPKFLSDYRMVVNLENPGPGLKVYSLKP